MEVSRYLFYSNEHLFTFREDKILCAWANVKQKLCNEMKTLWQRNSDEERQSGASKLEEDIMYKCTSIGKVQEGEIVKLGKREIG